MLQRIRRVDLLDVVKWYKSNSGPRLQVSSGTRIVGRTLCVNVDGSTITPGLRVAPKSFFPASISFENALKQLYNGSLKIAVGIASTNDPNWGTAIHPSRVKNGLFSAVFEGLFTSIVTGSGSYLLPNGALATDDTDAIGSVIATSAASEDGRKLALLKPINNGGEGLTKEEIWALFETKSVTVLDFLQLSDGVITPVYKTIKTLEKKNVSTN